MLRGGVEGRGGAEVATVASEGLEGEGEGGWGCVARDILSNMWRLDPSSGWGGWARRGRK